MCLSHTQRVLLFEIQATSDCKKNSRSVLALCAIYSSCTQTRKTNNHVRFLCRCCLHKMEAFDSVTESIRSLTFLVRAFFLLVIRSISSNNITCISLAFPRSKLLSVPSWTICLRGLTMSFSHGCFDSTSLRKCYPVGAANGKD